MTIIISVDGSRVGNNSESKGFAPWGWAWVKHPYDNGQPALYEKKPITHYETSTAPGKAKLPYEEIKDYDCGGGHMASNNHGELVAVYMAILAHPGKEKLLIKSDSQYAQKAVTEWYDSWKKNNWKNSKKKTPDNLHTIKKIRKLMDQRGNVEFYKVEAHTNDSGNDAADHFANETANYYSKHPHEEEYTICEISLDLRENEKFKDKQISQTGRLLVDKELTVEDLIRRHTHSKELRRLIDSQTAQTSVRSQPEKHTVLNPQHTSSTAQIDHHAPTENSAQPLNFTTSTLIEENTLVTLLGKIVQKTVSETIQDANRIIITKKIKTVFDEIFLSDSLELSKKQKKGIKEHVDAIIAPMPDKLSQWLTQQITKGVIGNMRSEIIQLIGTTVINEIINNAYTSQSSTGLISEEEEDVYEQPDLFS